MRRIAIILLIFSLAACNGSMQVVNTPGETLLLEAQRDVQEQRYDHAMEKALGALEVARHEGDKKQEVKALQTIVGIDIMSSHDADAWEKALEVEAIARGHGFKEELAGILISKAKLCSYAEISPETGRNDEGLEYAKEALALAEETGAVEQEAEACFVIGSLYINKNRWNDPIDQALYRMAGEYLDRGQEIADSNKLDRLRRNGLLFRSRWFQQGDRNEEALRYFEEARETLPEDDHLMASALDDRLVRLYTRTGDADKALDTHDEYVYHITKYMTQKSDEAIAEMETRFQVQEKDRKLERRGYQIVLLLMLVLLAAAVIVFAVDSLNRVRRRNAELKRISDTKEQLIAILSNDLRNPANAQASELDNLSADAATLSPEEIRERCRHIAQGAQTINEDVADYVGNLLIERSKKIADIGLSQREIQIIRLSAEGLTASEIAGRLFLSVHTVNTHRQHIYSKMEVKNVSDMLQAARKLGII